MSKACRWCTDRVLFPLSLDECDIAVEEAKLVHPCLVQGGNRVVIVDCVFDNQAVRLALLLLSLLGWSCVVAIKRKREQKGVIRGKHVSRCLLRALAMLDCTPSLWFLSLTSWWFKLLEVAGEVGAASVIIGGEKKWWTEKQNKTKQNKNQTRGRRQSEAQEQVNEQARGSEFSRSKVHTLH